MPNRLPTKECPRCIGLGSVVLVVYPEVRSSGCDLCAGSGRVRGETPGGPTEFGDVLYGLWEAPDA